MESNFCQALETLTKMKDERRALSNKLCEAKKTVFKMESNIKCTSAKLMLKREQINNDLKETEALVKDIDASLISLKEAANQVFNLKKKIEIKLGDVKVSIKKMKNELTDTSTQMEEVQNHLLIRINDTEEKLALFSKTV